MEDLKQVTECLRILANQFNNTLVLTERDRILKLMEQLLNIQLFPLYYFKETKPDETLIDSNFKIRIEERRRFIGMLRGHFPDGFKGMSDLIPQILAGVADKGE